MATYKELVAQIEKLKSQAEQTRQKEVGDVVSHIHDLVKQYGLTPFDLGIGVAKKSRAKSAAVPKYRDPETGSTWTGRGRAPAWMGKDRSKFAI